MWRVTITPSEPYHIAPDQRNSFKDIDTLESGDLPSQYEKAMSYLVPMCIEGYQIVNRRDYVSLKNAS
jgi:hypothetical protein